MHTRSCLCPPRVYFPVLCKFWQLCVGVNDDLLQEGLCYTQVCCTQSPCPRGSPLLTRTYTGDTQTQFCLSLCEVPRSWYTQGWFDPSERLWWEWGLILNVNSPLLPFCLGFSAGSDGKASACNAGDPGPIPGLGRSPGEGNGNPLQYSCLENSMDGGAWWATVNGVTKSRSRLSDFTLTHFDHLAGVPPLPLDMGYLLTAAPVPTILLGFL